MNEFDEEFERQLNGQEDMKHEDKLNKDPEYAMEHLGLPQIITMLEYLSRSMARYGHEYSVKELIEELEGK